MKAKPLVEHRNRRSAAQTGVVKLVLTVPLPNYRRWEESARRAGMSVDEWLITGVNLADRLALASEYPLLPEGGRRLDPLLAEAILRAGVGQPWEHKAIALAGMTVFREAVSSPHVPKQGTRLTGSTFDRVRELMLDHGLPIQPLFTGKPLVEIGVRMMWQDLALILLIWHRATSRWVTVTADEVVDALALPTKEPVDRWFAGAARRGFVEVAEQDDRRFLARVAPTMTARLRGFEDAVGREPPEPDYTDRWAERHHRVGDKAD